MPALTTAAVSKYTAAAKRREIPDAKAIGLYLVVQPKPTGKKPRDKKANEGKSWALRFRRPDGRPAKIHLGKVDLSEGETADEPVIGGALTLRQARQLANQIDRERARGVDVAEHYKAARLRQHAAAVDRQANVFGAALPAFFAKHKTRHKERARRWRGDAATLGLRYPKGSDPAIIKPQVLPGSLADIWGSKPLAEIDEHDVDAVVTEAKELGIPGLPRRAAGESDARGRKLHAALSVLFGWLRRQRKITSNPCDGVDRPGPPKAREKVLDDSEISLLWRACDKIGPPYGPLFQTLLLSGCRLAEAGGMRRDEHGSVVLITKNGNEETKEQVPTWTIPAARSKNHKPCMVPLPPLMLEVLGRVKPVEGSPFIFATADGGRPLASWTRAKAKLDATMLAVAREENPKATIESFRLHDLRRSCASGMQRLGVRSEVIERALNHRSGSFAGVAGVYQRDPLLGEVREALARWAAHIEGLASDQRNVVPLRAGKGKNGQTARPR